MTQMASKYTDKGIARVVLMILCMTTFLSGRLCAQTEPEYLMEIGGSVGMTSLMGDFNNSPLKDNHPSLALVGRYNLNPRQSFKLELGYRSIKGSSDNSNTYYPDYQNEAYSYSGSITDLNLTYEYNFWPYGTGKEYRGAKRLTPFVFVGLGATYGSTEDNSVFTANIPLGLGIKYKAAQRININLDWRMHFSMSDKLDGVKDPYLINSTGMFKNTDCYSALTLSITYSFKEKCRVCHKE